MISATSCCTSSLPKPASSTISNTSGPTPPASTGRPPSTETSNRVVVGRVFQPARQYTTRLTSGADEKFQRQSSNPGAPGMKAQRQKNQKQHSFGSFKFCLLIFLRHSDFEF